MVHLVIVVHYHVDWCTKKMHDLNLDALFIFNLHRETPFYWVHAIQQKLIRGCMLFARKIYPLLWKAISSSWWWIPILSGPLLEVTCLYALCPPLTPASATSHQDIYLLTQMTLKCLLLSCTIVLYACLQFSSSFQTVYVWSVNIANLGITFFGFHSHKV